MACNLILQCVAELNTSADVFVGMRSRLDKNAKRVEEVGTKRTSQGPASSTVRKKRNFVTRDTDATRSRA